ncbi:MULTISPECIES: DUF2934 domain-containing protein [Mesorhizobium]|uniref:DUF2934 domain-containing protein n=1 Tax=Mesorhizobium denitrificans TaxID=2294114 RepID=A0A371X906_9HYPH|nr:MULTISPECIES: DUF2934 domain-containing protein [Mesorhizobium]RFC65717.1 DUF2934 domain-containing protein [Mesorhizobium denitrificans]
MSGNRDERIRERAHAIWDREGKPEGAAQRHWQQAEGEIEKEDSAPKKAAAKKPAAKKPVATSASAKAKKTGADAAPAKRSKDTKKPSKA